MHICSYADGNQPRLNDFNPFHRRFIVLTNVVNAYIYMRSHRESLAAILHRDGFLMSGGGREKGG